MKHKSVNDSKTCIWCGLCKPLVAFSRKKNARQSFCKECAKQYRLQLRYGISIADYEELLKSQNYVCAICGKPEIARRKSGISTSLAVDHNHQTGQVRGLLCLRCNTVVGNLESNLGDAVMTYLAKWEAA